MAKVRVEISMDPETYFHLRSKGVNISGLVRELLKKQGDLPIEYQKLQQRVKELEKELERYKEQKLYKDEYKAMRQKVRQLINENQKLKKLLRSQRVLGVATFEILKRRIKATLINELRKNNEVYFEEFINTRKEDVLNWVLETLDRHFDTALRAAVSEFVAQNQFIVAKEDRIVMIRPELPKQPILAPKEEQKVEAD